MLIGGVIFGVVKINYMKQNTILRILSFIMNALAIVLLLNGVGKLATILIIIMVVLVNYFDGLTRREIHNP